MNIIRPLTLVLLVTCGVALCACSPGQQPASGSQANATSPSGNSMIDNAIDNALARADTKLHNKNITVSNSNGATGQPKAEITPQGDFLIEGKPVALTPAQQRQMLAYRQQLVAIGEQGIAIGKQGAKLGLDAAGAAIAGAFSGESKQQIRAKAEARASGIRQAAAKLCKSLPTLMATQQKLATEVPAFKPYATMTQKDIDDCRTNALKDSK